MRVDTTTRHLLDLQPGLTQVLTSTTGANVTRYVGAPGELLAQKDPSANWEWMLADGLGSVRGVVSSAAGVLEHRHFDPFGNLFAGAMSQTDYGFTGEPFDSATGLVYLRARHYRPANGTFVSRDPFEGTMSRPMSRNGYSWVEGRVADGRDASGMIYETPEQWNTCFSIKRFLRKQKGQTSTSQLTECQLQYLAHVSAAEATGASSAALAGIMLAQINYYNATNAFYGFETTRQYLNANVDNATPIPGAGQRQYTYQNYIRECEGNNLSAPNLIGSYAVALTMAQNMSQDLGNPLTNFSASMIIPATDYAKLQFIASTPSMRYEKGISDMRRFIANYDTYPQIIPRWGRPVDFSASYERVIFWPGAGQTQGVVIHSGATADLPAAYYCRQPAEGPPAVRIGMPDNNFCQVCDDAGSFTARINGETLARSCKSNGVDVGFRENGNPY